jgi:GT2 family glycosyltransferase
MNALYFSLAVCGSKEGKKPGRDLGWAYNREMLRTPDDSDWVCLLDADTMPTTKIDFRDILEAAIAAEPEAGAFLAVTNRLSRTCSAWQMINELPDNDFNILHHLEAGKERTQRFGAELQDVTNIDVNSSYAPLSGFAFVVQKATWRAMGGFLEGRGMYGIDWDAHRRIRATGKRIYLLKGWYVFHGRGLTQ